MLRYSPQQDAIFAAVKAALHNLLAIAVAGAGKTTTLTKAAEYMRGSVGFTAFNKPIAEELKTRLPQRRGVGAGTFHSYGFGALMRGVKVAFQKPDTKKVHKLALNMKVPDGALGFVTSLVSLAKQRALNVLTVPGDTRPWFDIIDHFELAEKLSGEGFLPPIPELVDISRKLLAQSNQDIGRGIIDFDDMIYGPLVLDLPMFQHDWLLVDECQDTNPARRALARKMMKPDGRCLWVGDPCQAIYGFTGADNDAVDVIKREFNCVEMPLTVTYRCPKTVVALAKQWVPYIEAAAEAPEGTVVEISETTFAKLPKESLTPDDAVLCRLTKPLVALAYQLIGRGLACHVEGREIGQGLVKLITKLAGRGSCPMGEFLDKLDEYQTVETQRLIAKGQETAAEAVEDKCDCIRVIADQLTREAPLSNLLGLVNQLFEDTPEGGRPRNLTLSTVHKAKGREWDRVYLLGRNKFMPSKWARQEWQYQQELNLMYVAVTRAKCSLVEVTV